MHSSFPLIVASLTLRMHQADAPVTKCTDLETRGPEFKTQKPSNIPAAHPLTGYYLAKPRSP